MLNIMICRQQITYIAANFYIIVTVLLILTTKYIIKTATEYPIDDNIFFQFDWIKLGLAMR